MKWSEEERRRGGGEVRSTTGRGALEPPGRRCASRQRTVCTRMGRACMSTSTIPSGNCACGGAGGGLGGSWPPFVGPSAIAHVDIARTPNATRRAFRGEIAAISNRLRPLATDRLVRSQERSADSQRQRTCLEGRATLQDARNRASRCYSSRWAEKPRGAARGEVGKLIRATRQNSRVIRRKRRLKSLNCPLQSVSCGCRRSVVFGGRLAVFGGSRISDVTPSNIATASVAVEIWESWTVRAKYVPVVPSSSSSPPVES